MKTRKNYLDVLRGIGAILVIVGHLVDYNSKLKVIIYSFHIPLFFFISGYLYKKNTTKQQIINKSKSIIIPYFIFMFLSIIVNNDLNSNLDITDFLINILYLKGTIIWNSSLWFLPVFYFTSILYTIIDNRKANNRNYLYILFVLIIGIILMKYKIILPFGLHIVPFSIVFYYSGILANKININVFMQKKNTLMFFCLTVLTILLSLLNTRVNMSTNVYNDLLIYFITAHFGIISCYYVSYKIKKSYMLELFGKYSLEIFATQRLFFNVFVFLSSYSIFNRGMGKIPLTLLFYIIVCFIYDKLRKICYTKFTNNNKK